MKHVTKLSWLILILIPLIAVVGLAYSMNQPPSRADIERLFGSAASIDRVLPLDGSRIVLYHTTDADNFALLQRRWGSLDVLQSGSSRITDSRNDAVAITYRPIFLVSGSGQIVQGRINLPTASSVRILLDDGQNVTDVITANRFGVVYFGNQAVCSATILDTGANKIGEYPIKPYSPDDEDATRYDCVR